MSFRVVAGVEVAAASPAFGLTVAATMTVAADPAAVVVAAAA
jgi:hypothetical protein